MFEFPFCHTSMLNDFGPVMLSLTYLTGYYEREENSADLVIRGKSDVNCMGPY